MPPRIREEVLNVVLAQCLVARAISANPETIAMLPSGVRAMPDVIFTLNGVRCCIEGKLEDTPDAENVVTSDAQRRVDSGIAQIAAAVVYPVSLRSLDFDTASRELSEGKIKFRILSEVEAGPWQSSSVDLLVSDLRRAYDVLVSDDIVADSVEKLNAGMESLVLAITRNGAAAERLARLLGVYEPTEAEDAD